MLHSVHSFQSRDKTSNQLFILEAYPIKMIAVPTSFSHQTMKNYSQLPLANEIYVQKDDMGDNFVVLPDGYLQVK